MELRFKSVLIITYGRSGSTLLQGILNSIKGVLIRGENANMCYPMFHTYKAICQARKFGNKKPKVHKPWFGSEFLSGEIFLNSIQPFVHNSLLADLANNGEIVCIGFKEIRYTTRDIVDDFDEYLEFLKKLFPNVAFIFNTRNIKDTKKSAWWSEENSRKVKKVLTRTEHRFEKYAKEHPENSFRITHEDVIGKTRMVEQLFEFLGATYDSKKIDEILKIQHSYQPK